MVVKQMKKGTVLIGADLEFIINFGAFLHRWGFATVLSPTNGRFYIRDATHFDLDFLSGLYWEEVNERFTRYIQPTQRKAEEGT